ncbi:MAG: Isoquinoline 1-oxidoreductase subunit [Deltaproteobacteria bacterium]|nr:Isoquinoline 1-oxidoreductase subunit [Deltaproteobacteria bacterium]MDQ3300433.1 Isoquinoline 1-oxidoreductase subunit [Myxococcota bacterium]
MQVPLAIGLVLAGSACGGGTPRSHAPLVLREVPITELRSVGDFAGITDSTARSQALFGEASRVLLHPRCINCHPAGDVPHQGMQLQLHDPPVVRGADNRGVAGMQCASCHQDRNQPMTRVPGAPNWHLAPIEMAWVGRSAGAICDQLKDPKRNGGKTLAQIVEHSAHDELVAWGWQPGADREPAPGTQQQFGALVAAWVETGAACPDNPQESR